jgi:hypothetical protein
MYYEISEKAAVRDLSVIWARSNAAATGANAGCGRISWG